jgi:hypothetical protein
MQKVTADTYSSNVDDEHFPLKYVLNVMDRDKAGEKNLTCQRALKAPYSTESSNVPGIGLELLGSDAKMVFVMSSDGEIG